MKRISLQFKDVLQLLEFLEYTKNQHCAINVESVQVTGELSEADIELAINGYDAIALP